MNPMPNTIAAELLAIRLSGLIPPARLDEWRPVPIEPICCQRCHRPMVQGTKRPLCKACAEPWPLPRLLAAWWQFNTVK